MKNPIVFGSLLFLSGALCAQVPDAQPAPAPQPAPAAAPAAGGGAAKPQSSFLGKDVPAFDPGSNILTWDGKNWNISNNELFQARFEKYLSAPEETTEQDKQYQLIIKTILTNLAPGNATVKNVDDAFRLLPRAAAYDVDAHLCDALADAVFSAWRAQAAGDRIAKANENLEQERKQNEWNAQMAAGTVKLDGVPSKNKAEADQWSKEQQLKRDMKMQPYVTRLAEVLATIKTNQAKQALTEIQTKIEFQALIVQFFLQRRFQHVLMATRFYRAVFTDGDTKLQLGKDAHDLFSKGPGMPPTVSTLDSLANEAISDVHQSVDTYKFLLSQNELESATKRLAEAFSIGEYMPELRTLPRDDKRQALDFYHKSNQLISAIDVKDYTLAEKLVHELEKTAKDFDNSKPMAAIETAKTVASFHLAKAKGAAVSGDKPTLETELKAATEIWPRNPALAEVAGLIFTQGDAQGKAFVDFDQLLSQKNYRQIYDDRMRFIAACVMDPKRAEQLKNVLADMQKIETALMQADARSKQGDYAGAWENVEKVYEDFPDDSKLNGMRATLTTEAPDFVHTLRNAEDLEKKDQVGSSLAWYLKAQKIYPGSEYAHDGIDRMVKKILPQG